MSVSTPLVSLKGRALRLLGNSEHSRLELHRKLKPHAADHTELDAVLDDLQAKGFISEQRVVESVIHRRAGNFGAARIRQELQQKGLAAQSISGAVAELQATELVRAKAVWARKFANRGAAPGKSVAECAKQMRFLAARGFADDIIRRVIRGVPDDGPQQPWQESPAGDA